VLERDDAVEHDTAHTSAHLSMVTDAWLSELVDRFGRDHAQATWDAGLAAIAQIDAIVRAEEIACDFAWVPGYLHRPPDGVVAPDKVHPVGKIVSAERFRDEATLAADLGFDAAFVDQVPFVGGVGVPGPLFREGTWSLLFAFALMNLLVLLEVADRLSLKNDLEIAREIQQAMLPGGLYSAPGVETVGLSRPANTVGGDFYDILPLDDGRLVVTVGDVAGKGSPAALLMALLLAMLRTLVDEKLEPAELITRLNTQVCRHAPGTRFITLFYAVFEPLTGKMTYVSAGHTPPLLIRADGSCTRLTEGGIALGMFDHSTYKTGQLTIQPDEVLAVYSDGVTEAENAAGRPFDEEGLENALKANRTEPIPSMGSAIVRAVEQHSADTRLADDLTILLLRRLAIVAA